MSDIQGSCLCGDVTITLPKDLPVGICRESLSALPMISKADAEQTALAVARPVEQCKTPKDLSQPVGGS